MGGKNSGRRTQKAQRPLSPNLALYEKQPGESDKAWEAFVTYRDMPSRTLAATGEVLGKTTAWMEELSVKWSWRRRVEEWDREVDRRSRAADLKAIEEMRERQLKLAISMQGLGTLEMQKLITRAQATIESVISVDQARSLAIEGVKLERLNRDQPGEINEERRTRDLDDEEVEKRIQHLLKTRRAR